ncbi:MAG: recombinase family protein [Candidatus Sulfotelmatobacter sp.]
MTNDVLVPAAQYVRMSTEHQQYSLENQSAAIDEYANAHGFSVVRTYHDSARTAVVLKRRLGLRQLLQDVVSGSTTYKAILVYDVSRWGRFQDTDEAAHYEFLCKSAGVRVHYCAETFANDDSLPNAIMKSLKRTMAGEYSRELGVKVRAGQRRLASLGFKQGGRAGYGLRRLLISPSRQAKQELTNGERKSIATDRVILVPGPSHEVQIVRDIYRMFISRQWSLQAIANALSCRNVPYPGRSGKWDHYAIFSILNRPKYCGSNVYGRTSSRLYTPKIRLPEADWVVTPAAFEPIVDPATFESAQQVFRDMTVHKSNEQLLQDLKTLLAREGRLSISVIENSADVASVSAYAKRFGSIRKAYELIGYGSPEQFSPIDGRCRTVAMRDQLVRSVEAMFSSDLSVTRKGGRFRTMLRVRNGPLVSVLLVPSVRTRKKGTIRWRVQPAPQECKFVTLLARLDESNLSFLDFHLFADMDRAKEFYLRKDGPWLSRGVLLDDLGSFLVALNTVLTGIASPAATPEGM